MSGASYPGVVDPADGDVVLVTIPAWIEAVTQLAARNGWGMMSEKDIPEKLALIHSEISEALEEYRSGHDVRLLYKPEMSDKPEGFGVELADAVIRIFDLAGQLGIDLEKMISVKHAYNATRPYRHGGKLC